MGRYLALGVATTIQLSKKENYWVNNYNLLENKQKIMEELNDLIDISKYDCKELENKIVLTMKPKCFNDNIHDLIKELYPMIDCKTCMEHDEEIKFEFDDKFDKENYPINLSTYEEGPDKGWMYCEYFQKEDYTFYEASECWLFKSDELKDNVSVDMSYIRIWLDMNKINSEDETNMLGIMNKMFRAYFKSSLSRNAFFYISG